MININTGLPQTWRVFAVKGIWVHSIYGNIYVKYINFRRILSLCLVIFLDGFRVGVSTNQGLVNVYSLPEMAHIWSHKFDDTVTSIILPPSNQAASAPLILLSEKVNKTIAAKS